MRKLILALFFVILFVSSVSSEILITQQPKDLYNLGDTMTIPVKITTLKDISGLFTMKLICNGLETEVYKEYIILSSGDEKIREPYIPLIQSFIGKSTGTCKIKISLDEESQLTDDFEITDFIKVELKDQQTETAPEKDVSVEIEATKENGEPVNGLMTLKVFRNSSENILVSDVVKNGYGFVTFSFPKTTAAGNYLVSVNVSEEDSQGEITNKGFVDYTLKVTQVPTNLEIIFDNREVDPDSIIKVKAILHDQTGEKIGSTSLITIKNDKGVVMQQINQSTDTFLEVPILYKEPPAEWTVTAESNNLTGESTFRILEKAKVKTEILNKTLVLTNVGNVYYNNTVTVKIENTILKIPAALRVDESKKYLLSAPDGQYHVEVMTLEGGSQVAEGLELTGKVIDVKESSEGVVRIIRHPISWIFMIMVLGVLAFFMFRKESNRSFLKRVSLPLKEKIKKDIVQPKTNFLDSENRSELSLSIKGDKQTAGIVCLKLKNFREIQSGKGNVRETLQKIITYAQEKKAYMYENQDSIFFILAPVKTKTFDNEKTVLDISQKIKTELKEHNNMFKQKIDFGISVSSGTIVAKIEGSVLKFMSMGTLITTAKKIASFSDDDVFLSEKIREKLAATVRAEKHEQSGTVYYSIKEIKDRDEHKNFINNFLKRLEKK
jgi:hypothetical protein